MSKRIIALTLCLIMCVAVFASCAGSIDPTGEYKGQQITMYLTDNVYDLDPIHAYSNESARIVSSLLFDTLFTLDEKGEVKGNLAKEYTIEENASAGEYFMYIHLNDTNWSDNTPVSADDAVFAWKRILSYNNSCEAAALLYDIKGARDYIAGEASKDDIGLTADGKTITIQFEGKIDYEQFVLNLTSLALAPLRENIVSRSEDWAKKPGTMVCSGPFKLARISFSDSGERYSDPIHSDKNGALPGEVNGKGKLVNSFVLERNSYYYRNSEDDEKLDVSVTPYRIIVDCGMPSADIKVAYDNGAVLYVGDVPLDQRAAFANDVTITDSLSTSVCYFNQNATIGGTQLFAIPEVRQALSLVIDRETIAKELVYAEAADGLVPQGVFNSNSAESTFRDNAGAASQYLSLNKQKAAQLLADADVDPSDYYFSLTVAAYDDVQMHMGEAIVEAWCELGFNVTLNERGTIENNDYFKTTDEVPADICDDMYAEDLRHGRFEVILADLVAISADPFSVLAPFAKAFSGQSMDMSSTSANYDAAPHITGYDSEEYNALIEKIYAEKNIGKRASDLHKAEDILMEDLPVVPIVYNKSAHAISDDLKLNNKFLFWTKSSCYYGTAPFKLIETKDYDEYIVNVESFIASKYDEYTQNKLSYFGGESFNVLTYEEFKEEVSNYSFLYTKYDEDKD